MSKKMPVVSSKMMLKLAKQHGYKLRRQRGSHIILARDHQRLVVPNHDTLSLGVSKQIHTALGLNRDDFIDAIRNCK